MQCNIISNIVLSQYTLSSDDRNSEVPEMTFGTVINLTPSKFHVKCAYLFIYFEITTNLGKVLS